MKLVADAETKPILGAAILGTGGDEAIHGLVEVINAAVPYPTLLGNLKSSGLVPI